MFQVGRRKKIVSVSPDPDHCNEYFLLVSSNTMSTQCGELHTFECVVTVV